MENQFTIQDIIDGAVENEPTKVQAAFDQLVGARIMDALEQKKKEVASSMFRDQDQEDTTVEAEDENTEPAEEQN